MLSFVSAITASSWSKSTTLGGTFVLTAYIMWRQFLREVLRDDICVLEIRPHCEFGDGSLTSFIRGAHVSMLVNGVKQGQAAMCDR
ncbi:hypothetical protein SAMD00023353_0400160 [Rosellinia necatrix]|uniref:Uncharacterized protein n=1 Tax=Rosellinia necatrix TaxID=77044 RepID=A0A1S8A5B8_ROSNE|nr:hypothetical protein SAMD00023353_0400160 [Rosellinia necatrix]